MGFGVSRDACTTGSWELLSSRWWVWGELPGLEIRRGYARFARPSVEEIGDRSSMSAWRTQFSALTMSAWFVSAQREPASKIITRGTSSSGFRSTEKHIRDWTRPAGRHRSWGPFFLRLREEIVDGSLRCRKVMERESGRLPGLKYVLDHVFHDVMKRKILW